MNPHGLRFARLFRQARSLTEIRRCDLAVLAEGDGLEIVDFRDPEPGCTACLYPDPCGKGGAIFLKPGQNRGRRRFSVAHELGHYHIPTHTNGLRECGESALQASQDYGRRVEWEANSFAAELLMPTRLFRRDARKRDVSFEAVYELTSHDMYDVSATAAARRMVELSNEPCALVVTRRGRVEWQERSRFYYPMATRGQPVRGGTIAAAVTAGDSPNAVAETVDPADWLDRLPEGDFTLLESTHVIPSLDQVLSLLWIPDLDH